MFELPSLAEDWMIEDSMDNRSEYSGAAYKKQALPTMGRWYMDFVKRTSTLANFAVMHWDRFGGWEPVTLARPVADGQSETYGIERFGECGRKGIYLTIWGPDPPTVATILVDYTKMGFTNLPQVTGLMAGTKVQVADREGKALLSFSMEKNMTRILKLTQ